MNSAENHSLENPIPPEPLPPLKLFLRLSFIGILLAGIAASFAYAGGWFTPSALTQATMVDTFEKVNGRHSGFRRNHAKGVCVSGIFESNGAGAAFCKSPLFAPGWVPVVGRFALAGGMPFAADSPHAVRSLAVLFKLPNGEEWRTGTITIPVFPVHSPQAFHDLLTASASDPATGKADPAKMKAFTEKYPEAARNFPVIAANPVSSGFDNASYHALNAFYFTNAYGHVVPVRWSFEPAQAFAPIGTDDPGLKDKNYLFDGLIAAIHRQPLQWHLVVTIGEPGDPTDDASQAWPADRRKVVVGTLTINQIESEDSSPVRDINFDPLILPDGITPSKDPLLSARSAAYSVSFTRREGEAKIPSAVSTAETEK